MRENCERSVLQAGSQSGAALPVYQKQSLLGVGNGMSYASLPQQQTPAARLPQPAALPSTAGILTTHMQVSDPVIRCPPVSPLRPSVRPSVCYVDFV